MEVKVLGTGCCRSTASAVDATVSLVEQIARERRVDIELSKVEDLREVAALGVMSSPAVVIEGKLVHAGGLPSRERVTEWFDGAGKT